jgi:prolyl oligopeptidase
MSKSISSPFAATAVVSLLLVTATGLAGRESAYPKAVRVNHSDQYHGVQVADPYRWLEDSESPASTTWRASQARLLTDFLQTDRRDALMERIERLTQFDLYGNPTRAGERYFFTLSEATQPGGAVYVQKGLDGEPRMLLDPGQLSTNNERVVGLAASRDGGLVAYQVVVGTSAWRELRVRDVVTGKDHPDRLEGLHRLGNTVSWALDGRGFYYVRMSQPESEGQQGSTSIHFHRLGTSQAEDQPVFARPDQPAWLLSQQLSRDGRYLIVTAVDSGSPHTRVFYRDLSHPESPFSGLFTDGGAAYSFLGNIDDRLWFYTTQSAPRGRIVALDLDQPERLLDVVPQSEDTIAGGSLVGGNAVSMRGRHLLITYVRDARPLVRIHDLEGRFTHQVQLPDIGAIWGGFIGNQDDAEVFYSFLSLSDPRTVYKLDVTTGHSSVFKRPDLPFDPESFETKQVFFTSKDGTRVPMFITHKRGLKQDGSAPLFMYGYGAWGWIAFPWYQPHVVAMLEKGWVYALPGIRGGGEYGESWHQAGIGRNKQNAIDDYTYAARWLIENRYTSASRMVANGGSASGALAASAVLQRPDLFGAGVIDIPALDMLRYDQLTPTRHAWTGEMGSISDAEDFKALLAYSPYHNVKPETCYPPFLTMAGEGDETAPPPHSYKFTAAMQHAQNCDAPVMLKVIPGAGHSHGNTGKEVARTWADAIAFLEQAMALTN